MRLLFSSLVGLFLITAGCANDGSIAITDDDDECGDDDTADDDTADDDTADDDTADDDSADDDDTVDDEYWSQCMLDVSSPTSGEFFPLGTPMHLEAQVLDGDGGPTGWEEIVWTTDQDPMFEYLGAVGDVQDFPVGSHTVFAETELPNGDRLVYAVGGVLVQHENAGVYAGLVNVGIDMTIQQYPISASCIGSIDFVVDQMGETLDGTGGCIASVAGLFDLPIDLVIQGNINGNTIDGSLGIDIAGWFQLPSPFEGEFPATGEMTGDFYYDASGTIIQGTMEAHRIALTP